MYIELDTQKVHSIMGGGQIINVSTISKDGVPDVMTCAWNTTYDYDKPLAVLALEHTTTKNILQTGRYVIALPTKDALDTFKKVGSEHGSATGDKFKWAGITPVYSKLFHIPVIPNALAYIECELLMKDMFEKTGILVGQAKSVLVDAKAFDKVGDAFIPGVEKVVHHVDGVNFYSEGKYFN